MPRLIYTIDEWHDWYADLLAQIDSFTPADVLARWVAMAAPSYDPAGHPPSDEALASAPRHKYLEAKGQWWVRADDASTATKRGISWDSVGPFLRLPSGEIVRDRSTAKRHLGGLADDPIIAALLAAFLTGRQDGRRKSMSREVLARALVILGLRDGGLSHWEAIRTWLHWEAELCGSPDRTEMSALARPGRRADLPSRQLLRTFMAEISLSNRRTWRAIGLPVEFASQETP
jgi:hypothetical protein